MLEQKEMLAADGYRSIDGTNNNLANPTWGVAGTDLLRTAPAQYGDSISTPGGQDRPNPRDISNMLVAQSGDDLNDRDLSAMVYAWGQFIDHDLDLTPTSTTSFNIDVPVGDEQFDPRSEGGKQILLNRSVADPLTGKSTTNPLQQINNITSYLDGSMIYGSDLDRSLKLRTREGGKLLTSAGNLLPLNTLGLANDNPVGAPATSLFVAGDVRANENGELTSLHTLFVREHNRLTDLLKAQHSTWDDEQLYQAARKIVIAEIEAITFNEWLPAVLGPNAIKSYRGYNPGVNPAIANEFSAASFRVGHSMVGSDIEFLGNDGEETRPELELRDNFFNPQAVKEAGIDPILKYLASDRMQEVDNTIVDELRNFLFGRPGQGGLDLASLNIQRGRDHGLADYNTTRVAYGLRAARSFADITSDVAVQGELRAAYGTTNGIDNVNKVDLWVGGLAEDHVSGASVGPLLKAIIGGQFQRLRDGDRFWYQNTMSGAQLAQIQNTSLADIIRRNTTTTNLQENVFFFHGEISGRIIPVPGVVTTASRTTSGGVRVPSVVLSGITVQLLDSSGEVVATTQTRADGTYKFTGLDLGTYQLRLSLPNNLQQTSTDPDDIELTRGIKIGGVNFSVSGLLSGGTGGSGGSNCGSQPSRPTPVRTPAGRRA